MLTIAKVWGTEQIVCNEPEYCFKVLTLNPGFSSSSHFHRRKKETFIIQAGCCDLVLEYKIHRMVLGEQITIEPERIHRFYLGKWATEPCMIYEISTHHEDSDVVRLSESGPIE